eukprot:gene4051-10686_t
MLLLTVGGSWIPRHDVQRLEGSRMQQYASRLWDHLKQRGEDLSILKEEEEKR